MIIKKVMLKYLTKHSNSRKKVNINKYLHIQKFCYLTSLKFFLNIYIRRCMVRSEILDLFVYICHVDIEKLFSSIALFESVSHRLLNSTFG